MSKKIPSITLSSQEKEVYREQDEILRVLRKQKPFPYVLSGGTALARFYFHHRYSEDRVPRKQGGERTI